LALLINHEHVGDEAFLVEFRRLGGLDIDADHPHARREAEALSRLAEERVIGFVLLRQQAVAEGITVDPAEIEARRREQGGTSSASVIGHGVQKGLADSLLVEKYCNHLTRHEQHPSRAEVEAYYRSRREEFRMLEQVNLMQIIRNIYLDQDEASAKAAIEDAERELQAEAAFPKVADRYSDCGGKIMLGWVKRGEMVAEFEDVAFATQKGQRSPVFRTIFGLHIISVLDRKAAGYQLFEEVRSSLARQMLQTRKDRRIRAAIAKARQNATVVQASVTAQGAY
jgi:parvulin-like peptidyl-prolyl isomerase